MQSWQVLYSKVKVIRPIYILCISCSGVCILGLHHTIPYCPLTWSPFLSPASAALLPSSTDSTKMPNPLSLPPCTLKWSGDSLDAFCRVICLHLALAAHAMFSSLKWPFIFWRWGKNEKIMNWNRTAFTCALASLGLQVVLDNNNNFKKKKEEVEYKYWCINCLTLSSILLQGI